jgi:hypothetical protein
VDQIKQAINKKNEENQTKSNLTDDNFQINYSIKVLKQIKTKFIDNEPAKLINEIINNFCIQSKINKDDLIHLLINKTKRNYETHGIIDDFIDALIDDQYTDSGGSSGWRSGDRHPLGIPISSFFPHKNEKIRVILPRIGFKNRFFCMVATPSLIFWIRHCNTKDQVIQYLEVQNDVTLMINSKEKDIIIKLCYGSILFNVKIN